MYKNPHNGQVMESVYVDKEALHDWHGGWHPNLVDYLKPLGVVGVNDDCDCGDTDCRYHEPIYMLCQHELYPDGVFIDCPVRFTTQA